MIRCGHFTLDGSKHLRLLYFPSSCLHECALAAKIMRTCVCGSTSNGLATSHWGQAWLWSGPSPTRLSLPLKPLPLWLGEPLPSPLGQDSMTSPCITPKILPYINNILPFFSCSNSLWQAHGWDMRKNHRSASYHFIPQHPSRPSLALRPLR